jgi:hypothetical protein
MSLTAPPVDDRNFDDIVNQALILAKHYCPEWQPILDKDKTGSDEPGMALVHLFGRLRRREEEGDSQNFKILLNFTAPACRGKRNGDCENSR